MALDPALKSTRAEFRRHDVAPGTIGVEVRVVVGRIGVNGLTFHLAEARALANQLELDRRRRRSGSLRSEGNFVSADGRRQKDYGAIL